MMLGNSGNQPNDTDLILRAEVDELLRDYPDTSVAALLAAHEKGMDAYDGAEGQARAVAEELRRRIASGVRFWPVSDAPRPELPESSAGFELDDDEIPW